MSQTTNNPIELTGFRHPVTQQVFMMPPDDAQAYLQFTGAFFKELHPQGILEEQLAQSLADAQWRLNFVRALENNIFSTEAAAYPNTVPTAEPKSQAAVINARRAAKSPASAITFSLYEHRLNRQFHQNLKLLRELQIERRQQRETELAQAAQIVAMEKAQSAPNKPFTYSPADDGFVFSISEIEAHIRFHLRQREAFRFNATRTAAAGSGK